MNDKLHDGLLELRKEALSQFISYDNHPRVLEDVSVFALPTFFRPPPTCPTMGGEGTLFIFMDKYQFIAFKKYDKWTIIDREKFVESYEKFNRNLFTTFQYFIK